MCPTSLAALFVDYLVSGYARAGNEQLADALTAGGYLLEAAVLRGGVTSSEVPSAISVPDSPWHGRRVWAGMQVPRDADVGDLWLDTCELTPMLLVPDEEPTYGAAMSPGLHERVRSPRGWLATRPLQRWQFAAFLELARFTPRAVQLEPPLHLLDPRRLLQGAEAAPIANLTADEAGLCANWFGKAVCGQLAWQAANAFLEPDVMRAFWGVPAREWAGRLNEECRVVVTPRTLHADPREEEELDKPPPPPGERMVFGEWAVPAGVTFRTCVPTQLGLFTELGEDGNWHLNVRLASRAARLLQPPAGGMQVDEQGA